MIVTCAQLNVMTRRKKVPMGPGIPSSPPLSRMVALIAVSRRPYVVPGSDSTALMKLYVMAPVEVEPPEKACRVHGQRDTDTV